jgi:hypothetical protein
VAKQLSKFLFFFFLKILDLGFKIQDFASLQPRASHQEDWILTAFSETVQTHLRIMKFPPLCFDFGPRRASSLSSQPITPALYLALKLARWLLSASERPG